MRVKLTVKLCSAPGASVKLDGLTVTSKPGTLADAA